MLRLALITCLLYILLNSSESYASSKLELGGGLFYADIPHYLGSDQSEQYILPVPYVRYQSDDVDVDRNSFTGYLLHQGRLHLDLSAGVSLAVDSKDNRAREGMDDLDWVFELGPSLNYYLIGEPQAEQQLYMGVFVRKATATDFSSITNVGWRYGPSVYFETPWLQDEKYELTMTMRANANFADGRYLNYFYGVPESFTTSQRAAYNGQSGFSGADISVGLNFDTDSYWLGGFVKYALLSDSQQRHSPLVKQSHNVSIGIGMAWKFYTKHGN